MMKLKRFFGLALTGILAASIFVGCGKKPADLTGEWKQVNSKSEDSWQEATIQDGKITINWVSSNGDSKTLYWEGSYVAPTDNSETYVWVSENQRDESKIALMASNDETKTFTYENGKIVYEVGVMGVTSVVELDRQEQE